MMNMKTIGFTSALLLSAVTAFAADSEAASVETQQKSLLEKLDSINAAVLGLKLNGTAKAGVLTSMASSDQFADNSPTQETQAYTDVNLLLTARPSSETMVRIELRLHKDWQSAYDENNNPIIGHWFSYDGLILDKHLGFNLGYMRVGYSPYTIFAPQPELLQEPEIFAKNRVEALAQRNLDTTSRRLMQGLNADFHSGAVGALDDIQVQATGARLRNSPKKYDELFFDFDWSDRYMIAGRIGADLFGAHVGANIVEAFDRRKTTRSMKVSELPKDFTLKYDDNMVFSGELGFDSKKMLADLPVSFGLFGEFAYSSWNLSEDYFVDNYVSSNAINLGYDADSVQYLYVRPGTIAERGLKNRELIDDNGTSFYVEPYIKGSFGDLNADLKLRYLQNDKKFWSELASTPAYQSNTIILNSNAFFIDGVYGDVLSSYGASSLENLYFSVYNVNPLNQLNIMNSDVSNVLAKTGEADATTTAGRLYNNYKSAHFYRNGYSANTMKMLEAAEALALLDPSVNLALPYGIATPDRKGFAVSLDLNWNDAAEINARFSQYEQDVVSNKFTQYAAGLGVDVGRLIGLDRKIEIQGSYDHAEEDAWYKRSSEKIMAGVNVDVWGPVALLGGYQMVTKEYGNPLVISETAMVNKAEESLLLVGPRIKLSPLSYLSVQYGMLTDKVTFMNVEGAAGELSIDKNVIVADVTVNF